MHSKKLFAILHDGSMNGDCSGDVMDYFPVTEVTVTLKDLKAMSRDQMIIAGYDSAEIKDELKEMKGAWIIEESTTELMSAVVEAVDPGCDSTAYACNRALKAIARKLAIASVGKKVS
jgi:hypothetical protein